MPKKKAEATTVWRTVNTKDRKRPGAVSTVENLGYTPEQIASLKANHWKIVKEERNAQI